MVIRLHIQKTTLIYIAVCLAALVGTSLILWFWGNSLRGLVVQNNSVPALGNVVEVLITPTGFKPDELAVVKGTTVRFINNDTKQRWPASDIHPTHDLYPEFDPKSPVETSASWQFTFEKVGEWKYHDHLLPHQKGTITVTAEHVVKTEVSSGVLPAEIATLKDIKDPKQQAVVVKGVAEKYGPKEALGFMKQSGLPYTGETHLLVHEIGNVAYEKFGYDALLQCDDSFLSACYHGVVIHTLGDHGFNGVATLIDRCKSAGTHVVTQCAHGAGHGFLAYVDYKVLDALPMCDKLASMDTSIPAFNCYDGVFMENIFGVHDGAPSPNRMVKQGDPGYPCNAVPEKYRGGCWANQATLMYQLFKGDYKAVARQCDAVTNPEYQRICYHNFARQIHPVTEGKTDRAVELCKNATGSRWQDQCLITLVEAAFSVGDRQHMPFELCGKVQQSAKIDECYNTLYQQISSYGSGRSERQQMCGYVLDNERKQQCLEFIGI
mgnify:CR=1 FL=1